ncbi:unnamed protein product [Cuscuta epithymum]|uniref:Uncharacterized protein n=1 Tax=Cuscuta epithymum TaxID=186058 RepID=A0AAV0CI36_9ASTE|nr:unnamed protein product [Cuscuta epithymum]
MPMTFRGLVGQNLVVKALSNAIHKRKVGSLYAFYGPSGTGKTCCARIFSRALNCKSRDHHSKPCGACSSCINNLNVREIGPVSNVDFEDIMDLLEMMSVSQYRVFIFDGCDNLATRSWNAILKFIDRAPRKVVFVLICSRLDELPHMIISRCQKFFFPKLRDVDMIRTLRRIAAEEEVEIDEDALKLVATRAYGSLRDGEMTLEQLSLLGQRVTVSLVQELVGLISDEKLVDLLDLALSADTINTVRNLRGIIKAGVEPLALMSQLATVITDILAGSYDFSKDRSQRRKFFRRHALTKDDLEKLRQALKTLSEAEKQLRVSNDRVTWLTAALLQLAPDQQDQLLISSADTSFNQSPLGLFNYGGETELLKTENVQTGSSMSNYNDGTEKRGIIERKQHSIADIWMDVIKRINVTSLKEFLYQEGRLVLVRFGAAPKVRLVFRSHVSRSKAEKFRVHISQAFESVLGSSPVMLEIRDESRKDLKAGLTVFPTSRGGSSSHIQTSFSRHTRLQKERVGALPGDFYSSGTAENEIVELESTPSRVAKQLEVRQLGNIEQKNMSLVRGKVSLAQVLQLAEGCAQQPQSIWSHRMAVSFAEKLEHDNLRLEPRYRSLFCWKSRRVSCPKLKRLRTRSRRPKALLKLVSCGKCLSGRSSR